MSSAVKNQLRTVTAEWEEHYRSQRFDKLSELYTEDCKVYPPGKPITVGRGECAEVWQALRNKNVAQIQFGNLEIEYDGSDMAAERGTFKFLNRSGVEMDHGEHVVIWKQTVNRKNPKKGAQWHLQSEIYNSNVSSVKTAASIIREQTNKWEHFYAISDFDSLSFLYNAECKLLPPNRPIADGRIACARVWGRLKESGVRYIKIDEVQTLEMGEGLVTEHSSYIMKDSRGKQLDHGKFVRVWKLDGQWFLHYDTFNSDVN